jgi:hypothetical protein
LVWWCSPDRNLPQGISPTPRKGPIMDATTTAPVSIATMVHILPTATIFGEKVDTILTNLFKYVKPKAVELASGLADMVLEFDTNRLIHIDQKVAVQFALTDLLYSKGMVNENGTPRLFSPVTIPFHISPEDGVPETQLRVYFYRKPANSSDPRPQATIMLRLERFGTEYKFDTQSKYGAKAVANAPAEATEANAPFAE